MSHVIGAVAAGLVIAASAAGSTQAVGSDSPRPLTATLTDASGRPVGTATATAQAGGISVTVEAMNLSPGQHGVHVHMVGRCDAPDFTTAGSHWNPMARQHGTMNTAGAHAGDMPNLVIGADGKGHDTALLPGGTIDGLLDADGAAVVIHAGADDMKSDPAGNSGGRIACGVLRQS